MNGAPRCSGHAGAMADLTLEGGGPGTREGKTFMGLESAGRAGVRQLPASVNRAAAVAVESPPT